MKYPYAVLGLVFVLGGCGSDPDPEAAVTPSAAAQAARVARAAADPTTRMARAVGGGKPGAAVELKYEFLSRPTVGKPVEVELALIPNAGVNSLDVTVSGMEGVSLAGNLTANFADVKTGQVYKHQFSLLAEHNGVYYLTVAATTHIGGASMGRTFSIPFVVGTPAPKEKPAAPQKDATGQPVQPMPAEESSR